MFASFITKFRRHRRAAVAVAMALMTIPLTMTAMVAVDAARLASARALLQSATDAAAIASVGAWQTSQLASNAHNVAEAAYYGTGGRLSSFVSTAAPAVELTCTGTTTQCGANSGTGTYVSVTATYGCPNSSEYCVIITASAQMKNTLFGWLAPAPFLSVKSMATANFPPETITGRNIPPSPGFGSAGDVSGIYAYAVPMSGTGRSATPEYNQMPQPNSACGNYATTGPLALLKLSSVPAAVCNYLFIALSTSQGTAGAGGSITLQQNQPVAFTFTNYTGANGYHSGTRITTSTNLEVYENGSNQPVYYENGLTVTTSNHTYTTNNYTCSPDELIGSDYYDASCPTNGTPTSTTTAGSGQTGAYTTCIQGWYYCTTYQTSVTTRSNTPYNTTLTGECPNHTLYGSLDPVGVNATTGLNNYGIPAADSLNVYSSAYEVLGEPPTYETNHALIPFISPWAVGPTYDTNGNSYRVKAVCPNYSRSNTAISAPVSSSYAALTGFTGLNIYSTAFPGQNYTDSTLAPATDENGNAMTTGLSDIFPPAIAGCTPALSTEDNNATYAATDPWWNWNNSNSGNCSGESNTNQNAYTASGQAQYSNCTLLIQPLGTNVPVNSQNQALLPDYYLLVEDAFGNIVGMDPVWDGQSGFTDLMPGVITNNLGGYDNNITINADGTIRDTDTAAVYSSSGTISSYGYTPNYYGTYTVPSGQWAGDTVVIERPAHSSHYDFNPPQDTSHQCYNPSAATQDHGYMVNGVTVTGYNADGTAIDPVANPQLGAVYCNTNPPETYGLYWNDLGTYGSDDLGYWNSVEAFTCSVPNSTGLGGGPATLSG